MAERRTGIVVYARQSSPILSIFRLMPEAGSSFPDYKAGQYIALRREDCRLTRRVVGADGLPHFVPDLDEAGRQKRGPITHSYSISSAPCETKEKGFLEFYVVLERDEHGDPGRLTESLFRVHPSEDESVGYVSRIVGDFTLDKRAAGFKSVLLVGTGTGLAPFVSMIKQLAFETSRGTRPDVRYTLLHTNRTREEMAYHEEMAAIEAGRRFDFLYLPSVSRPSPVDLEDPRLGRGRANNLLRHLFDMPLKEQEELEEAASNGKALAAARDALERMTRPVLPRHVSREELRRRLDPAHTVILTCGNAQVMADIKRIADVNGIRFEKEDW